MVFEALTPPRGLCTTYSLSPTWTVCYSLSLYPCFNIYIWMETLLITMQVSFWWQWPHWVELHVHRARAMFPDWSVLLYECISACDQCRRQKWQECSQCVCWVPVMSCPSMQHCNGCLQCVHCARHGCSSGTYQTEIVADRLVLMCDVLWALAV